MMSYLDCVKKRTVVTLTGEKTDKFIKQQLEYYRFQEEKKITVEAEEYTMFELDN